MKEIDIKTLKTKELYQYLTSAITPRPIALVSTISENGMSNLSPYSFFNVFSIPQSSNASNKVSVSVLLFHLIFIFTTAKQKKKR